MKTGSGTKSEENARKPVLEADNSQCPTFWAVELVLTCVCQPVSVLALHFLPRGGGEQRGSVPTPHIHSPPTAPPHSLSQNSPPPPLPGNIFSGHCRHYDHPRHQHSQQDGHKVGHFWDGIGRGWGRRPSLWSSVATLRGPHPPKFLMVAGSPSSWLSAPGAPRSSATPQEHFLFLGTQLHKPFRGMVIQLVPRVQSIILANASQRGTLESLPSVT